MKPRGWRSYSGWYKPPSFGHIAPTKRDLQARESAYLGWLCSARGFETVAEARAYVAAMDTRKLIGANHSGAMLLERADCPMPVRDAPKRKRARIVRERVPVVAPEPVPMPEPACEPEPVVAPACEPEIAPLPVPVVALVPARDPAEAEIARRRDAAALLRELAAAYGPRRAHKMRAMADFIDAPAATVALAA